MYQVRHAGAKGFGIFASQSIARGSRILAERPLISISTSEPDCLAAARKLTGNDLLSLLGLSYNESKRTSVASLVTATWKSIAAASIFSVRQNRDILDVFHNNNFALADGHGTRAVFLTVARLNHSCIPSAQGNFNSNLGCFTIHALREIASGEEITISYLHDELALYPARQSSLKQGYGFDCACEICAGPLRAGSHERRVLLQGQLELYGSGQQTPSLQQTLAMTRSLIDTYKQEGLAGRELASLYSAAAGLAVRIADYGQAFSLGARSLELERDAVGDDSRFYEASHLAFSQMSFKEGKSLRTAEPATELSYAPWT